MRWLVALFTCVAFLSFSVRVGAYTVPQYDGLVNDFANVLPDEAEARLEQELTAYAQATAAAEIAVVTIQSLQGEPVEYVTQDFFDEWGIGKRRADNGVLLLIAVEDRELRIQTGYGVEGNLPDAVADRIIRDEMVPQLKNADYLNAVTNGVRAIQGALDGDAALQTESISETEKQFDVGELLQASGFLLFVGAALLSYLTAFLGRSTSWWVGGVIGAVLGIVLAGVFGMLIVGGIGLLLDYILSKNYKQWNLEQKHTSWTKSFGGFHSTGYRSSSSSKSFSFGGGRSGGGGASGKW